MADSTDAPVQVKLEQPVDQTTNGGTQETDTNGKMDVSSPRKRDRPHNEETESAGNAAKRVKGVAPIKTEHVRPCLFTYHPLTCADI